MRALRRAQSVLLLLLCSRGAALAAARVWVHPGVVVEAAALHPSRAASEPVASALAAALASPLLGGSPSWRDEPPWTADGRVDCGLPGSGPDVGCSREDAASQAAYLRLVLWRLTGTEAHAGLALGAMRAYASGLRNYTGAGACLQSARAAAKWSRCAELARWPAPAACGWSASDGAAFAAWLASVHGPLLLACSEDWSAPGSWALLQAEALAGVGVATEDEALLQAGLSLLHARLSSYVYSPSLDGAGAGPPQRPDVAGAPGGSASAAALSASWHGQSSFGGAPGDAAGVAAETCAGEGGPAAALAALAAAAAAAETGRLQGEGWAWELHAARLAPALELHASLALEAAGLRPRRPRPGLCGGRAASLAPWPRAPPPAEVAFAALSARLGVPLPHTAAYLGQVARARGGGGGGGGVGDGGADTLTHGGALRPVGGGGGGGAPARLATPPRPTGARFCLPGDGGACYSVTSPASSTVLQSQAAPEGGSGSGAAAALRPGVTLLLQSASNKLAMVRAALAVWPGPASVVLYAADAGEAAEQRAFRCAGCVLSLVAALRPGAPFPINLNRQVAVFGAPTELCLVLDADFVPSLPTYWALRSPRLVPHPLPPASVYVVPAFEQRDPDAPLPLVSLGALRRSVARNATGAFHILLFRGVGHGDTRASEWMDAAEPYGLNMKAAKSGYEPYLLFNKSDPGVPLFVPLFVNRGHNKASWVRAFRAAAFNFTVLPGAWVTHIWEAAPFRLPTMSHAAFEVAFRADAADVWRDGWQAGAEAVAREEATAAAAGGADLT